MMSRAISSEVLRTRRIRRNRDFGISTVPLAATLPSGSRSPWRLAGLRRPVFVGFTKNLASLWAPVEAGAPTPADTILMIYRFGTPLPHQPRRDCHGGR